MTQPERQGCFLAFFLGLALCFLSFLSGQDGDLGLCVLGFVEHSSGFRLGQPSPREWLRNLLGDKVSPLLLAKASSAASFTQRWLRPEFSLAHVDFDC
jgi:hypothetical protein